VKKRLNRLIDGILDIYAIGNNREEAWTAITNTGAEVVDCAALLIAGEHGIRVSGKIKDASLLTIERLERDGWTW